MHPVHVVYLKSWFLKKKKTKITQKKRKLEDYPHIKFPLTLKCDTSNLCLILWSRNSFALYSILQLPIDICNFKMLFKNKNFFMRCKALWLILFVCALVKLYNHLSFSFRFRGNNVVAIKTVIGCADAIIRCFKLVKRTWYFLRQI